MLRDYDRDFMMSLSDDKQADVIDAFYNTTSRYLDDILNINNHNIIILFFLRREGSGESVHLHRLT